MPAPLEPEGEPRRSTTAQRLGPNYERSEGRRQRLGQVAPRLSRPPARRLSAPGPPGTTAARPAP